MKLITVDYGGGRGGKKCQKNDNVICEPPLTTKDNALAFQIARSKKLNKQTYIHSTIVHLRDVCNTKP